VPLVLESAAKYKGGEGEMSNLVALPAGTELAGDFRIKKVLGAGGFGITYLADELALARQVTIKEYFPTDYAARKDEMKAFPRSKDCAADYKWGLDRFIEEAQVLAKFDHPNIVRVYRYFRANNTGYMVLQFEEGGSFKAWLRNLGRAPRQTELDAVIAPLLDALELIHKGDFLHRDIAPDNIIVRKDKTPVLIDFGSARGEIGAQSRTVSALVKPGYSPYEQYASNSRQQGPWTDIYALAATIYQALTGKRPPDAPSRMVRDEYVSARDAAMGSYRVGFLNAIDKALRLEVGERPQSIAEWRGALLAPDPKPAAATPVRARIGEVLGLKRTPEPDADLHVQAATEVLPPPPDAPQPPGQHLDFVDGLRKGQPAQKKPQTVAVTPAAPAAAPQAAPSLEAALTRVQPEPSAGQRFGLGYGAAPDADAPRAPVAGAAAAARVAAAQAAAPVLQPPTILKPAGAVIALPVPIPQPLPQPIERRKPKRQRKAYFFLRHPWRGLIFKAATGIAVASLFTIYQDQLPRELLLPKSQALVPRAEAPATTATAPPQPVRNEQAATLLASAQQLAGPTGVVKSLHFSAEGRSVVTAGSDATLRIWDANSGALLRKITLPEGAATALATDEKRALTGHADGTLALWDLEKGERLVQFRRNAEPLVAVAFAPDADNFIAAGRDDTLTVWSRKTPAAPLLSAPANGTTIAGLVRVSARDAIAYAGPDKTIRLLNSEGLSAVRSYRGHLAAITALDSPDDGRALASASADGQIRVWSTASTRLIKSFQAHAGAVTALSYAPSGEALASIGADGMLKIWDAKRGRLLASAPQRNGAVRALAYAADGRRLAVTQGDGSVQLWDAGTLRLARD
jgi:serine/threonine protein kinase